MVKGLVKKKLILEEMKMMTIVLFAALAAIGMWVKGNNGLH